MSTSSALTSQCPPAEASLPKAPRRTRHPNEETNGRAGGGHGFESSTWKAKEAASPHRRAPKRKRKRKRKAKGGSRSTSGFFEGLTRQLVEHLEGLQREFLDAVEKIDRGREEREEAWRREEAEKRESEAAARARERALASAREAMIISSLEKITGQRVVGLCSDVSKLAPS